MREKIEIKRNRERGITLIALVITIVILIILSIVAISVVFGEGGLIDRAEQGKDMYEQAQKEEHQELLNTEAHLNELLSGTGGSTQEENTPELNVQIKDINYNKATAMLSTNIADDKIEKIEYSKDNGATWTNANKMQEFEIGGLIANKNNEVQIKLTYDSGKEVIKETNIQTPVAIKVLTIEVDASASLPGEETLPDKEIGPLGGAEYTLYSDERCINSVELLNGKIEVTADEKGEAYFVFNKVDNIKEYYLKMIGAPEGYIRSKYPIKIDINNASEIDESGVIQVKSKVSDGWNLPTS